MHILGSVMVRPVLPERISGLQELSRNLWWSWNPKALQLFIRLDPQKWEECHHSPVTVLSCVHQEQLEKAANDPEYLQLYDSILAEFRAYMDCQSTRFDKRFPDHKKHCIAYFSAEFGLHESLPIYSGGLGILSGDHMKTASDLGAPMVGVGLLYTDGYFVQSLDANGWQEASYHRLDFSTLPVEKALDADGNEIVIDIKMPDRVVYARVWTVHVGRINIYLLDTDTAQNSVEDRNISSKLYGGDNNMRIAQEMILGIGGVRALRRLGIEPCVWHMNEGHSAFLTLELMRELVVNKGLNWHQAIEALSPNVCFTTHTPVPAGQDEFSSDLMERHFWELRNTLQIQRADFMRLGQNPGNPNGPFNMTIFALKLSRHRNGVSKLHGAVSRRLWRGVWPNVPGAEMPITHVTNGVHAGSWIADELSDLYTANLGERWREYPDDMEMWAKSAIPHEDLWATHQTLKSKMIAAARRISRRRFQRVGCSPYVMNEIDSWLNKDTLTIGFARRFATYKRAVLIFSDLERLRKIVLNPERPVNLVFAGKAHPADNPGKQFIQRVHEISQMPEFRGHVVLLEDYDINLARHLVQGVDVWLNNPRRPLEASGTSGEKAAMNGVLNFSVLDGWWAEGFNGKNGWAIGEEREYDNNDVQDLADANSLYSTLENEIVPLYYHRDEHGVPQGWVERMLNSITTLLPMYSTHRMLHDYCHNMYIPAAICGRSVADNNYEQAMNLAKWYGELSEHWKEVYVDAECSKRQEIKRNESMTISARVYLGHFTPEDVRVQVYAGVLDGDDIVEPQVVDLNYQGYHDGAHRYEGSITPHHTGNYAYAVRAVPVHPANVMEQVTDFITWAR